MAKLTKVQKEVIIRATPENDYCTIAHPQTVKALEEKMLAGYTSGFGYRFGVVIELTKKGKELHHQLKASTIG